MSERRLSTMSDEEFDVLIDRYIERGSKETDDLDADMYQRGISRFYLDLGRTQHRVERKME